MRLRNLHSLTILLSLFRAPSNFAETHPPIADSESKYTARHWVEPANLSEAEAIAQIRYLYRSWLGREATEEEVANRMRDPRARLQTYEYHRTGSGTLLKSINDNREDEFRLSEEGQRRNIHSFYHDKLYRAASKSEVDHWIAIARKHPSGMEEGIKDVFFQIAYSDEALAIVISKLYQHYLNRNPSSTEIQHWIGEMRKLGYAEVDQRIHSSPEGNSYTVVRAYSTILGRVPSNTEIETVLQRHSGRPEYTQLTYDIADSDEATALFIRKTYERDLGRPATENDVTFWMGEFTRRLPQGGERHDIQKYILFLIRSSEEAERYRLRRDH